MLVEGCLQVDGLSRLRHLRKCCQDLLFRKVDVFQGVFKELVKLLGSLGHVRSPNTRSASTPSTPAMATCSAHQHHTRLRGEVRELGERLLDDNDSGEGSFPGIRQPRCGGRTRRPYRM